MNWSFSALTNYEVCPYKRRLALDKVKEEESDAILKGHHIHNLAEQYLRRPEFLAPELKPWADVLDSLKSEKLRIEELWGMDQNWQRCDWRDPKCWVRVKLDVCVEGPTIRVIDWKSGKKSPIKHAMQGNLYLLGAAAYFPDAERYQYEFYYPDDTPLISRAFTKGIVETFRGSFERRANQMLSDKVLLPKPHKTNCKFCGYRNVCEYSAYEAEA